MGKQPLGFRGECNHLFPCGIKQGAQSQWVAEQIEQVPGFIVNCDGKCTGEFFDKVRTIMKECAQQDFFLRQPFGMYEIPFQPRLKFWKVCDKAVIEKGENFFAEMSGDGLCFDRDTGMDLFTAHGIVAEPAVREYIKFLAVGSASVHGV